MPAKKGPPGALDAKKGSLSAVLLADSFTQQFRPISVERPKVLLPLVGVPLIDYTLAWVAAAGIAEIVVFCCAHAQQVVSHIEDSKWASQRGLKIRVVVATNCRSAGDALRALDQQALIEDDFVLVSGDVVANLDLAAVVQEHQARKAKDNHAIMTMVMKPMASTAHRWRLGLEDSLIAMDPDSKRLLRYDFPDANIASKAAQRASLEAQLWGERDAVSLRTDLTDCNIAVCSLEVLVAFSDNFDYQNLQRDFVSGVLSEEELGNKIYIHEAQHDYAVRVHNVRTYDAVSSDILQRWSYPFCPDTNLLPLDGPWGPSTFRYNRNHIYKEQSVNISRSATVGHDTAIGAGSSIADQAEIHTSVVGRNCKIGKGARICGSHLHDNVVIEDGASITDSLLCEGSAVMKDAVLNTGVILSFKVVIGRGRVVPAHARITLCQQHQGDVSDDDVEYSKFGQEAQASPDAMAVSTSDQGEKPLAAVIAAAEALAAHRPPASGVEFEHDVVGPDGAGFLWPPATDASTPRFSTSRMYTPAAVLPDISSDEEGSALSTADVPDVAMADPEASFRREVSETFLRCVKHGYDQNYAVVELNGLKIAEDRTFADCACHIFTTLLSLCQPAPPNTRSDYMDLFPRTSIDTSGAGGKSQLLQRMASQLTQWSSLLQRFLRSEDDQVELLLTLEDFCSGEGGAGVADHPGSDQAASFASIFPQVLKLLYDQDVVEEAAFMAWAAEKEHAEVHERVYVEKAGEFISWLREAEEEEASEEDDAEEE